MEKEVHYEQLQNRNCRFVSQKRKKSVKVQQLEEIDKTNIFLRPHFIEISSFQTLPITL